MDLHDKGKDQPHLLSGYCPDEKCQAKLFFPAFDPSIECTDCGQRHEQNTLKKIEVVTNPDVALHNFIRNMLVNTKAKKGTDSVKVLGLSNYHCKLLSPLLTSYGMDIKTGKARLLKEMNQGTIFDCGVLSNRVFLIDPEHINIVGYGLDISGSARYLDTTLQMIMKANNNVQCLIPIHADGDGHCLVHAISRSLIGRELFWHPLRSSLKAQFEKHLTRYKELFHDFYNDKDWEDIIAECDPYFHPSNGEPLGLRNIHVFGLANVLKRPIILLDSFSGMQSSGDYSATFLPGLVEPSLCKDKDNVLNKPLCIAWSSSGHNHYIPLVGIKGRTLPKLPKEMIPKAWGVPQYLLNNYIDLLDQGFCIIGGDRVIQDRYILRLAASMEEVFLEKNHVHPALVADVHHYIFKRTGLVGVQPQMVIEATQKGVNEQRLFRCLHCDAVCEMVMCSEWFKPGGLIYSWVERNDELKANRRYSIPSQGLIVQYDAEKDEFIPENKPTQLKQCSWCQGPKMRLIRGDGTIVYQDGDHTNTRSTSSNCNCGFKHFWGGKEYDNLPQIVTVTLDWNNSKHVVKVPWFQNESDPSLNSNAYNIAADLVNQYFPGVFGSERLVQKIVDQILHQIATSTIEQKPISLEDMPTPLQEQSPTKIILSGKNIVHKEELTKSEIEKKIKKQIEEHAPLLQRRASGEKNKITDKQSSSRKLPSPAKSLGSSNPAISISQAISPSTSSDHFQKSISTNSKDSVKKIRVTTSDGKQAMLSLESTTSFKELQIKIQTELNIPSHRQRLRIGFPPRPLFPPVDENESLPLQHGDKVAVEIIPDLQSEGPADNSTSEAQEKSLDAGPPWKHTNIRDHTTEELLRSIENMPGGDSLDSTITALPLIASLMGRDTWGLVQTLPHLFGPNGLLYQQIQRDIGLKDNNHCRIPILPNKVFRYSAKSDRLEICLEPYGHFAVEAGIEERVLQHHRTAESSQGCASSSFATGSSGVIKHKSTQQPVGHIPFSGKGHTLNIGNSASLAHISTQLDHIEEDMDTDVDSQPVQPENYLTLSQHTPEDEPLVIKKGPGYSVISPNVNPCLANSTNTNNEMLQKIASTLENSLQDDDALQVEEEKCEEP